MDSANSKAIRSEPKVLVLLASFNGSKWIDEQIRTVLTQENVQVDLMISDDRSTDDTVAIISSFVHDSRVRILESPAPSQSASRNFFRLIRDTFADAYDYVALCDQDDLWLQDRLSRACSEITRCGASAYSCAVTAFWPDGKEAVLRQSDDFTRSDFLFEGAGQGCTFVLTAAFYRRVREFISANPNYLVRIHYHDWVIYALARVWGESWIFDRRPSVRYRQHERNDTGARLSLRGIWKRTTQIRNGWYRGQLMGVAQLCRAADPTNKAIIRWNELLAMRDGWSRKWAVLGFVVAGGRRRASDTGVLIAGAILGWI